MQTIKLPWRKWFHEGEKELTFPDSWDLYVADEVLKVPGLSDSDLKRAFQSPVGSPTIAQIANGRENAVIAIDDITRPTPIGRLLPLVLEELQRGGIDIQKTRIIVASGAHRPSTRLELENKLGKELLDRLNLFYHVPYENLIDAGTSVNGTPILTNRDFYHGDLKIAIGSIMPHPNAGFGGGRKLISVGLSSVPTLREFHKHDIGLLSTGCIHGNFQHDDLEDIMQKVGLDIAVETILTGRGDVADLVVGEPSQCFQLGVEKAWQTYATHMPKMADIVILNAYPKDYDLIQACNALWVTLFPNMDVVRPGGTVICTAPCPDGTGLHFLSSHGMSDLTWFDESAFKGRHVIWFAENVNAFDIHRHFCESIPVFRNWEEVLAELQKTYKTEAKVTVFPCAAMHLNPSNRGQGMLPF